MNKVKEIYTIVCIGSGGTGTLLLPNLTRMLVTGDAKEKINYMYLIDGDRVEKKNLTRQNFVLDDIGASKSIAYADILNDGLINEVGVRSTRWVGIDSYITHVDDLKELLKVCSNTHKNYNGDMELYIPIIIGCVDNNHCRMVCEEYFHDPDVPNCFYYDAGNELSSGEVVFAHKLNNVVLSETKSHYFPVMKEEDTKPVTEMSCEELNEVHPQHIITNMGAAWVLLTGLQSLFSNEDKNLLERIEGNMGYVFFDKDIHATTFVKYKKE